MDRKKWQISVYRCANYSFEIAGLLYTRKLRVSLLFQNDVIPVLQVTKISKTTDRDLATMAKSDQINFLFSRFPFFRSSAVSSIFALPSTEILVAACSRETGNLLATVIWIAVTVPCRSHRQDKWFRTHPLVDTVKRVTVTIYTFLTFSIPFPNLSWSRSHQRLNVDCVVNRSLLKIVRDIFFFIKIVLEIQR